MHKNTLLLVTLFSCFLVLNGNAQELDDSYYYYQGEKISLKKDRRRVNIFTKPALDNNISFEPNADYRIIPDLLSQIDQTRQQRFELLFSKNMNIESFERNLKGIIKGKNEIHLGFLN